MLTCTAIAPHLVSTTPTSKHVAEQRQAWHQHPGFLQRGCGNSAESDPVKYEVDRNPAPSSWIAS